MNSTKLTRRTFLMGASLAATAAFRLGLMAFEKDQAYAEAARWYHLSAAQGNVRAKIFLEAILRREPW